MGVAWPKKRARPDDDLKEPLWFGCLILVDASGQPIQKVTT